MAEVQTETSREHRLGGGSFYGSIQKKQELHDAIFTDLQHSSARKMPAHSHELAFFALLLEGDYREQYGRQHTCFGPFTISFRPAGIPHQDEVGPRGVRFFEIEIRPSWQRRLKECSGTLDLPLNDCEGGELLWLGMKLFRETRGSTVTPDLCIETLLAELLGTVARMPRGNIKDAPKWLNHTVDKLRTECCERLTLDELGKDAGVHPVHLSRVFRRCTGEGIGEYVHRLRIRAACEQMLSPEMPLAEIGLATGFADQSHFTRTFRRVTGMSPGAFRAVIASRA
jgi:AraC family transcriptional regulator